MPNIQTINPMTEEVIQSYPQMSDEEVDKLICESHAQYLQWRHTTFSERSKKMHALARILTSRRQELAQLMTEEMGKPITQALGEIDKCALLATTYADNAEQYMRPYEIKTDYKKSFVSYQALGVVFSIMPWNFPYWQVLRCAVPAVMAGNTVVLSHSPTSLGCGAMVEKLFKEAGFPESVFTNLVVDVEQSKTIIEHKHVIGVAITGSVGAGRSVASTAGQALKRVVLELGGSDPFVVLEDADLEDAAQKCVLSRLSNGGQICIAAKRIIVVDAVREKFQKLVLEKAKAYQMADPNDSKSLLGPLVRKDIRDEVHLQIEASIKKGAKVLLGCEKPTGKGYYYPASILAGVRPGMPAYDDEIFGPVIAFIDAKDEEEAIIIANDTLFGLGASVFTKDLKKGEEIATQKLHAGACFVNGIVSSHPLLPFGGIADSGHGRELAKEGMHEFVNTKTVVVA